jgi:hypothetical protein
MVMMEKGKLIRPQMEGEEVKVHRADRQLLC